MKYCTVVYVTISYSSNKEDARGDITTMKTITDYTRYWYGYIPISVGRFAGFFARSTQVPRNLIPLETHTAILLMVIMGQTLRIYRRIGPEYWSESNQSTFKLTK